MRGRITVFDFSRTVGRMPEKWQRTRSTRLFFHAGSGESEHDHLREQAKRPTGPYGKASTSQQQASTLGRYHKDEVCTHGRISLGPVKPKGPELAMDHSGTRARSSRQYLFHIRTSHRSNEMVSLGPLARKWSCVRHLEVGITHRAHRRCAGTSHSSIPAWCSFSDSCRFMNAQSLA